MKNFNYILISLFLLICSPLATSEMTYQDIYSALSKHDSRLPGSDGYQAALAALRDAAKKGNYKHGEQLFNTTVPHTIECSLVVNGKVIQGVFPLEPNHTAPTSTLGESRSGKLVYLGQGDLSAIDSRLVKDNIILLDIDSKNSKAMFNLGASAIIFVGNDSATQWQMQKHMTDHPITLARAFISRANAEQQGLLNIESDNEASIKITTNWKKVVASNFWIHLPANKKAEGFKDIIVLSAHLASSGLVPDYSPQLRDAANCALLAETIRQLNKQERSRDIVAVFFGAHYSAQEGARFFHWAANNAYKNNKASDYFGLRIYEYQKEIEYYSSLLSTLKEPNFFFKKNTAIGRDAVKALRRTLNEKIGDLNFQLRQVSLEAKDSKDDSLKSIELELRTVKNSWGDLTGDIMQADESSGKGIDPKREEYYQTALKETKLRIDDILAAIKQDVSNSKTHQQLADVFGSNKILMQFTYDFANDDKPWLHNFTGDHGNIYSADPLGLGFFDSHINALNKTYAEANPKQISAHLLEYKHSIIKPESLCTPYKRCTAALTAFSSKAFGYNLCTVGDALNNDQMPVRKDVKLNKLSASLSRYVTAISNSSKFSTMKYGGPANPADKRLIPVGVGDSRFGLHANKYVKGGTEIEGPAANALITVNNANILPRFQPGSTPLILCLSDPLGYIISPQYTKIPYSNSVAFAYKFDEFGGINHIGKTEVNKSVHINVFYCFGGGALVSVFPTNYEKFAVSSIYKGKSNAKILAERSVTFEDQNTLGVYTDENLKLKAANAGGIFLLGSTDTSPAGYGLEPNSKTLVNIDPVRQSSRDLLLLNESRLSELRKKNIILEDIETLHANAKDHAEKSAESESTGNAQSSNAHNIYSAALSHHAYLPLIGTTNDMIKAVVILLILSIPFSFALERLFFGFTSIYKQVAGFIGFFVTTFTLLYFAHPAFSLASSPIIIFLAFVIIIMSGMVVAIIMGKFKRELLALQGLQTSSHGSKSEGNTALASVVIGISTMRNRPLKTFLTALTIILLTFTILVFASFGSKIGVSKTFLGQNVSTERIEVKRDAFMIIPDAIQDAVSTNNKDNYTVIKRGAYYPYPYDRRIDNREAVLYLPKSKETFALKAILGLDPKEAALNPEIKSIYPDTQNSTYKHPIYLDASLNKYVQLALGDPISINGKSFQYAGTFNKNNLKSLSYLDDMKIIPPDFDATIAENGLDKETGAGLGDILAQIDTSSFKWTPINSLALINHQDLEDIRGFTNGLVLYPNKDVNIEKHAHNIAEVFDAPIYSKSSAGINRYFYTQSFDSSGAGDIIVPLILGGLIIFSSLLGSIVDREREIFTFSALGLAPPNVAALFFAESTVYAVIGGLGGYIISQFVALFLAFLSDLGIFQAPEMNFSSLSSTYTILLVMATVILSTIYPAMKAGKSANPGVARKWQMPSPDGDKLSFIFPFTVGSNDLGGILHFIAEHFESHKDASLGKFAAAEILVDQLDEINYSLSATISLAPFDLGIFQHFKLSSRPSDIEGILEIVVELERVSGSPTSWIRNNRKFIDDLRNQFLLWRSLPPETVAHYTEAARSKELTSA